MISAGGKFDVTETGITIHEIQDFDYQTGALDEPIVLVWANISQIEKIDMHRGRSFFALFGVFVVVMSVIFLNGPWVAFD